MISDLLMMMMRKKMKVKRITQKLQKVIQMMMKKSLVLKRNLEKTGLIWNVKLLKKIVNMKVVVMKKLEIHHPIRAANIAGKKILEICQ